MIISGFGSARNPASTVPVLLVLPARVTPGTVYVMADPLPPVLLNVMAPVAQLYVGWVSAKPPPVLPPSGLKPTISWPLADCPPGSVAVMVIVFTPVVEMVP